jgi:hypothetical protein
VLKRWIGEGTVFSINGFGKNGYARAGEETRSLSVSHYKN